MTFGNFHKTDNMDKNKGIKDDWVPFKIAKGLKAKGFDELCDYLYAYAFLHDGMPISFEDELDLRAEGRGDEVEAVEGGAVYCMPNWNRENDEGEYSMPTVNVVCKWIRELFGLHITTHPYATPDVPYGTLYRYEIYRVLGKEDFSLLKPAESVLRSGKGFATSELAVCGAIECALGLIPDRKAELG